MLSWFRDRYPFDIMERVVFGRFADEIAAGRRQRIRIWCAACSTGQEPYSLALTLHEFCRKKSAQALSCTEIVSTDISPTALFLAIAGRYDQIAMSRGMPQEIRDRYFANSGKVWILNDRIRKMATFKKLNLQDDFSGLGRFDVIFCRNVMIYFSDAFKRQLFNRFAAQLNPGAYLFLGASESAITYSDKFTMINDNKHLYYQYAREVRS